MHVEVTIDKSKKLPKGANGRGRPPILLLISCYRVTNYYSLKIIFVIIPA
ncbi:hypothetical protein MEG1DRAFT_03258 [Photorhabdus temperata subsp. temperata Meg1]|uniref:Uncharacterized protein n=1 Tax=Photorhabdus temperata subsp. temperata Meg1 TaxID=1393735 RepID=A0A081RTY2_PHOTE|nr:hypothetical protein MEG1DRAFT_03258 [Photorhabdus temperata subsp. temperata Meg1]